MNYAINGKFKSYFITGLIVGVISTFSAYILAEMEPTKLGSITIISFASSTLLFAIITEYLFDRKIALIYKSFDKLKKKEFDDLEYDNSIINLYPQRNQ